MFSIVIPVYNKYNYIEKCLYSVFNQTCMEYEVIVVNDGSTDSSLEILQRFIESEFKKLKIICQHNTGVSIARNNGVKAAKFDYIAFLDADDWWEPTYLEQMKVLIENYPKAAIYGSNYYIVKNGRKRLSTIGIENTFEKGLINYCQVYARTLCMPLWTGATVIRKATFESLSGFKEELKFGEDFDLWIRVALRYDVAFLNKPLANYNQDVELKSRAIGNLHKPKHHILWNLEYLASEESTDTELKKLIDNLRVYSLLPYFLNNEYREITRIELNKVDWSKQPASARRTYDTPILILKMIKQIKYIGSRVKQIIIAYFILLMRY